ncbi:MPN157 family protein [Mycoplasmoides alvi]|uniref:MPN157 family protein n=1 Tax=Mycoplasmoides alvi TaxID=78580 RepID=UPI00051C36EF|nr:hypothetical protein [Mycoplasmoides alvi]
MENNINEKDNKVEQKLGIKIIDINENDNNNFKLESKSKKNKSKKSLKLSQFNRFISINLNDKKRLKKEWMIIGLVSGLLLIFFALLLGFMEFFTTLNDPAKNPAVVLNSSLNNAMRIISIFTIALIGVPYVYMLVAFFFGITQIHKSKWTHLMIWFSMIIGLALLIVSSCILIAAYAGIDSPVF